MCAASRLPLPPMMKPYARCIGRAEARQIEGGSASTASPPGASPGSLPPGHAAFPTQPATIPWPTRHTPPTPPCPTCTGCSSVESGCGPYQSVTMLGAANAAQASMPHMPPPACTAMASSGSSIYMRDTEGEVHRYCSAASDGCLCWCKPTASRAAQGRPLQLSKHVKH